MSKSIPVANVIGAPESATSANTTGHTGMNALRLISIDMVVTLFVKRS